MSEILTPEEFKFTLLSIPDVCDGDQDHPHVADLIAHEAALRSRAEAWEGALRHAVRRIVGTPEADQSPEPDDLMLALVMHDDDLRAALEKAEGEAKRLAGVLQEIARNTCDCGSDDMADAALSEKREARGGS